MSRFTVDLSNASPEPRSPEPLPTAQTDPGPRKRTRIGRIILIVAVPIVLLAIISSIGAYAYWQSLKGTPQYSLALLADAARRNDQEKVNSLVDVDAVVEDFVPQVTSKAVELYGKGLPAAIVGQLAKLAVPILPSIKERARAELPRIIRDRVAAFGNVPFVVMVLGAGRYLDITADGDSSIVKSKLPDHPLELKLKRSGDQWKIVGVRDEELATDVARRIGQEIIDVAKSGGASKAAKKLGVPSLTDILKKADELIR